MAERAKISRGEFKERIESIRERMRAEGVDALFVYGDEFRRENLRYVCNYWPIFDRGAFLIPMQGEPILLAAPESITVAQEMTPWTDLRNVPDLCAAYVEDTIDYPLATYWSFSALAEELKERGSFQCLGVVGVDAMCHDLYLSVERGFGCRIVNMDHMLYQMREIKSEAERACMKEAGRIAQEGIRALLEADIVGMSETGVCGIAEQAARAAGAEAVVFTLCSSGDRTNYVVPRASTSKKIEDGDMVSFGLAVMYEGYTATCQIPFGAGSCSEESRRVIDTLIRAWQKGLPELKPGNPMKNFVSAVRNCFREKGLEAYDVYPPLHGSGLAEAENPYPDENTDRCFEEGMIFNTDISLFGAPGNSNRIEAGYIITADGCEPITPFVDEYCLKWLNG